MEELKDRIEALELLASKLKNTVEDIHIINIDIKRLEKILSIKLDEFKRMTEINKFDLAF